jgi:hypothetical protein
VSKTNAVNKGRDYYRAEQEHYRRLRNRKLYPEAVGYGLVDGIETVRLGRQIYGRTKVRSKVYTVPYSMDAEGKPITIPYQTCTLVRVRPE